MTALFIDHTGNDHHRGGTKRAPLRPSVSRSLPLALLLAMTLAGSALATTDRIPPASIDAPAAQGEEPTPPKTIKPRPGKLPKRQPPADAEVEPPDGTERIFSPASLNLFKAAGFRYQDTNYYACTATSVMVMLNFVKIGNTGGSSLRWVVRTGDGTRDSILAWERTHDTLAGGNGSDPHGWRNALNYYGWGSAYLGSANRVYDDYGFTSYERAIKAAVRALIRYRKPVGIAAWRGTHAQMLTGYDGLSGYPFTVDAAGRYTNDFSVAGLFLTDPLKASGTVNRRVTFSGLKNTTNTRIRFQPYYETDSPYDDPYTAGTVRARDEWYGRWVIVAPRR
jgi:hypothetical protein